MTLKTFVPEQASKSAEEQLGLAKIQIMFEDSFGMFNARGGAISDVQLEREKRQATEWFRSSDCEFFSDLAGTEHDTIIRLHDTLTYNYNTGKITLADVRYAIRNLGLKI
tara:strand:+ start:104 stop:433 length:330 start_codon:yes stop_codon:yes gene_type:complete